MKKLFLLLGICALLSVPRNIAAQAVQIGAQMNASTATAAAGFAIPTTYYHQISWTLVGAAPTACTITIDSAPDDSTWTTGGIIPAQTCTSSGVSPMVNSAAAWARINLSTFTGSGKIFISYVGYSSGPAGVVMSGAAAPTGTCTSGALYTITGTGVLYSCNNGAWATAGGSGAISSQQAKAIAANSSGTSTTIDSVVCTPPAVAGQYTVGYFPLSATAVAPTCPQVGVTPDQAAGATVLYSDNNNIIYDPAAALSLPTPTTLGNANFFTVIKTPGGTASTLTPVTWTVSLNGATAGASAVLPAYRSCSVNVDQVASTQWDVNCSPIGLTSPGPIGGTTPSTVKATTVTVCNGVPWIDPVCDGADPTGVADSTTAIQAAFNTICSPDGGTTQDGCEIRFAYGSYKISTLLTVSKNSTKVTCGGGSGDNGIYASEKNGNCILNIASATAGIDVTAAYAEVRGLTLVSASSGSGTDDGIRIRGLNETVAYNSVAGFGRNCYRFDSAAGSTNANFWISDHNVCANSKGDGFYYTGVNINAGHSILDQTVSAGGYGFNNTSSSNSIWDVPYASNSTSSDFEWSATNDNVNMPYCDTGTSRTFTLVGAGTASFNNITQMGNGGCTPARSNTANIYNAYQFGVSGAGDSQNAWSTLTFAGEYGIASQVAYRWTELAGGDAVLCDVVSSGGTDCSGPTVIKWDKTTGLSVPVGIQNASVDASPFATGSSTGNTLTAPRGYFVCTSTCTVTPPVPAAGYEFCVINDDNVNTVITLGALGSSARYENTNRTAYGTAGTGTFVSGGAVGDKVCIVGRDSTHYLTTTYTGTWTAN